MSQQGKYCINCERAVVALFDKPNPDPMVELQAALTAEKAKTAKLEQRLVILERVAEAAIDARAMMDRRGTCTINGVFDALAELDSLDAKPAGPSRAK